MAQAAAKGFLSALFAFLLASGLSLSVMAQKLLDAEAYMASIEKYASYSEMRNHLAASIARSFPPNLRQGAQEEIRSAITEDYLRSQVRNAVGSALDYLSSKSDRLYLRMDLSPIKEKLKESQLPELRVASQAFPASLDLAEEEGNLEQMKQLESARQQISQANKIKHLLVAASILPLALLFFFHEGYRGWLHGCGSLLLKAGVSCLSLSAVLFAMPFALPEILPSMQNSSQGAETARLAGQILGEVFSQAGVELALHSAPIILAGGALMLLLKKPETNNNPSSEASA
ncbi:MAG: hypothetical protein N3F07_00905 [Candidatus Micrarchaeota archaeon]|nr:hypothetical protein [Candidatus Micrarchaeota archaeon]